MDGKKKEGVRTLVVDDSPAVLSSLISLLEQQDPLEIVGTAENGREAIDKVGELAPDLVLMDMQMPVMNGLDAATDIRDRHPAVRVIICTIHDSARARDACRQAGADGFVSKVAGAQGIVQEIHRVLRDPI